MIVLGSVAVVAVLSVVGVFVWWSRSADRLLRGTVRRSCLVQCKDGAVFHGVLFAADQTCVQLRNASTLDENRQPRDVDGDVLIHRADVAFMQYP